MAQRVKHLPTMQEPQVRSLGWEDPLEKEMITPVLLPGKSHGLRSLVGYSLWGRKESDTTERLSLPFPGYKELGESHRTDSPSQKELTSLTP